MGTLIDFCKEDLFRYKGILSIAGWEDKFIFQVTHHQSLTKILECAGMPLASGGCQNLMAQ